MVRKLYKPWKIRRQKMRLNNNTAAEPFFSEHPISFLSGMEFYPCIGMHELFVEGALDDDCNEVAADKTLRKFLYKLMGMELKQGFVREYDRASPMNGVNMNKILHHLIFKKDNVTFRIQTPYEIQRSILGNLPVEPAVNRRANTKDMKAIMDNDESFEEFGKKYIPNLIGFLEE